MVVCVWLVVGLLNLHVQESGKMPVLETIKLELNENASNSPFFEDQGNPPNDCIVLYMFVPFLCRLNGADWC